MSPREMTSLVRLQSSLVLVGKGESSRSTATIQQTLLGADGPSFSDPNDDAEPNTRVALITDPVNEVASIAQASPLRHAPSLDSRFTPYSIPESVFFIYKTTGLGSVQRRVPIATAFVLNVPDVRHRTLARFLVTARHVVDPEWAHCSTRNPASIEVGLNRRSGGVGYETILLINGRALHYLTPADDTVDLAIMRLDEQLIPDLDSYRFVDTPFQLIPSKADLRTISANQQVVTASLEPHVQSDINAFPITRRGMLFSTPEEAISTRCGNASARSMHVWLIDGAVQQGVSGAPVYTSLLRDGEATPTTILLGIQAFAWPAQGVASITPSTVLADLIHSALLRQDEAKLSRYVIPGS